MSVPGKRQAEADAKLSDRDLVARVREGDIAAFELIMRRHNRRMYRIARSVLRNEADAEDAVQDAYIRAYERLADFRGPDGFASWLGRIAFTVALDRIRRRGNVVALDDVQTQRHAQMPLATQMPGPERLAASSDLRALIERAVDALPDEFRAVFVLRAVEGLPAADIASQLAIAEDTVRSRYSRARKRIRASLGDSLEALMPDMYPFAGRRCDRIVQAVLDHIGTPGA